jgi:hypothetical protein
MMLTPHKISSHKSYSPTIETKRIIERIAKNVLKNPDVAIVELIANSWDSGATRVYIEWPTNEDQTFSITDNGSGMTDQEFKERWSAVGYNRLEHQNINIQISDPRTGITYTRRTFGKNGIGKFAAFCFAEKIRVSTTKDGKQNNYLLTRNIANGLFDVEVESEGESNVPGTCIYAIENKQIRHPESEISIYIAQRFVFAPLFEIYLNNVKITLDAIPDRFLEKIPVMIDVNHELTVTIVQKEESDATIRWSGVAWLVNGRRVGDFSWKDFDDNKFLDGRTELAKKYTIIIEADCLVDIINEDWTEFNKTSSLYKDAVSKVSGVINDFISRATRVKREEKAKFVKYNTKKDRENLGSISKDKIEAFIDEAVTNCPSIKEGDLESLVKILSTLEKTSGKFGIIEKMSSFDPLDWDNLHAIISDWTVAAAKEVLDEIQGRLKMIDELRRRVENNDTLEVQELQPIMEKCLWIFGPEFDSIEYTSNVSIANCFQKFMNTRTTVKTSKNRPDFIIIPNSAISFYSTPSYGDDQTEDGISKLIILELKAPSVALGRDDKSQTAKYWEEFISIGLITEKTNVVAYLLGSKTQRAFSMEPHKEGNFTAHVMLFPTLLNRAESRLFNLRRRIQGAPFLQSPVLETH